MNIELTPICDADLPFLEKVYRSTREEELNLTDWTEEQKAQFISQQFTAQHLYYQQVYCDATFSVITVENVPAGRLYLWESEKQIRIVDIALLPEFRNRGIGSHLLDQLISKCDDQKKIPSIHVEVYNPALKLYQRLGFEQKDHTGVYFYMERMPKGN
jgi:ribosomal protein S18 acetylase RimI-like enzyme